MRTLPLALAALTLATPAAPAAAQDGSEAAEKRTVEEAQRFLSTFISRGGWRAITYAWFDGSLYRYFDGSEWRETPVRPLKSSKMIDAAVTALDFTNRCAATFQFKSPMLKRKSVEQSSLPLAPQAIPIEVNWRNVDPIELKDDTEFSEALGERVRSGLSVIWIWDPKTLSGLGLLHRDKAVAERAAFAFAFLQSECDPTAAGAF